MNVDNYEYNEEAEGIVAQKRGQELIDEIEKKIRKKSIAHFQILRIGKDDEEIEFIYDYLDKKGIEIRGTNITMEDVNGYKVVSKKGANYYDLPEVIDSDLQEQLFEQMREIKEEYGENNKEYTKDPRYIEARNKIWEGNLRLAKYISSFKKFANFNLDSDDLLDYANEGLLSAIEKFDYTRGIKFSTYAWKAIYRRIERRVVNQYRVNSSQYLEYAEIEDAREEIFDMTGREATLEELINITGYNADKINNYMRLHEVKVKPESLEGAVFGYEDDIEVTVDTMDDDQKACDYGGIIITGDGEVIEPTKDDVTDIDTNVTKSAEAEFAKRKVEEILGTLTAREAEILRLRFGMKNGEILTLEEVGKIFGVSRDRIRQIEAKALRKLRHPSRSKHLHDL